ncbi:MAG: nitroreductase family protein [Propionibacteriaceae bacterium]|nr:nitroreductase family protein [Propionibacteriaceae bacterium]
MNIVEAIQARRSTRAYDNAPLTAEDHDAVAQFIAQTAPPFGVQARVELIHHDFGMERQKLGSYGSVKGACDFMGLIHRPGPLAAEGAAYWFEQVVLHCTSLGLGTCWLAGFTHSSFSKHVTLEADEKLAYASPVGYVGGVKPLFERLKLFDSEKAHITKKPFETLFLRPDGSGLTAAEAGRYAEPLELTRIAPSAKNQQPFRVMLDGERLHFYAMDGLFAHTDLGIAMCHFEQSARFLGIEGGFEVLPDAPGGPDLEYVISWV